MGSVALAMLCTAIVPGESPKPVQPGSYLYQPAFCEDSILRLPARPYQPQPGDLIFSADGSVFWLLMHKLAGTSHPTHSMIAFRRKDGTMAILEAGPHDTLHIRTLDAIPHLASYEEEGRVWVRRRSTPMTREQSDRLTEFALGSDGKRFAIIRLGQQLTPLRMRGPVRTYFMGKTNDAAERSSYYCAELVMEALVASGTIDPKTARPAATYPRDIMLEHSMNPYLNKHLKLPDWDPPARWTGNPVVLPAGK